MKSVAVFSLMLAAILFCGARSPIHYLMAACLFVEGSVSLYFIKAEKGP